MTGRGCLDVDEMSADVLRLAQDEEGVEDRQAARHLSHASQLQRRVMSEPVQEYGHPVKHDDKDVVSFI